MVKVYTEGSRWKIRGSKRERDIAVDTINFRVLHANNSDWSYQGVLALLQAARQQQIRPDRSLPD
jgi:hypothetical protein